MPTEKQIAANRLNALKGGVKTEAGKVAVRLNAVSHGLFSKEVLLPGENGSKLAALRDRFYSELQPVGEIETLLVERIITSSWRLRRALRLEKTGTKGGGDYRYSSWQQYLRYETTLERQIFKALHELQVHQTIRLAHQDHSVKDDSDEVPDQKIVREIKDFLYKNSL